MAPRLRRWLVVILAVILGWLVGWPRPVLGVGAGLMPMTSQLETGARLFAEHCVGCHINGGNVIRRGKSLRLTALAKAGLEGPEAVARVATQGQGQMGGYGEVLGPEGAMDVGVWVWEQALANWPKSDQKLTESSP